MEEGIGTAYSGQVARIRLGDLLVKAGLIDEHQLQSGLAHQRQWGGKLGDILVGNGFLDEMMLWRGLSKQLNVPLVSLPEQALAAGIEKQISYELCVKHAIFPIHRDDKGLTVATSDPANIGGLDEIAFRIGSRVRTVLAPEREVEWAIRRYHQGDPAACPPPRMRRVIEDIAPEPPPPPPPPHFATNRVGTPMADFAELMARSTAAQAQAQAQVQAMVQAQWQQQQQQPPPPQQQPQPWSSPQTAPTDAELMMRETAHLLRFLVEACVQRGVFTREEYLTRLRSL